MRVVPYLNHVVNAPASNHDGELIDPEQRRLTASIVLEFLTRHSESGVEGFTYWAKQDLDDTMLYDWLTEVFNI